MTGMTEEEFRILFAMVGVLLTLIGTLIAFGFGAFLMTLGLWMVVLIRATRYHY